MQGENLAKKKTYIFIGKNPPEILVKYRTETRHEYVLRCLVSFWIALFEGIEQEENDIIDIGVSGYLHRPIASSMEKLNDWFTDAMTTKDSNGKLKIENMLIEAKANPKKMEETEQFIFAILSAGELK